MATTWILLKEDFIRKSTTTTLLTKYIHICTSHHQLHLQTLHIIQNEVLRITECTSTYNVVHWCVSHIQLKSEVYAMPLLGMPSSIINNLLFTRVE